MRTIDSLDTLAADMPSSARSSTGLDVVDKIAKVPTTTRGGHGNVPVKPVYIKSAKRKKVAEQTGSVVAAELTGALDRTVPSVLR